MAGLRSEPVSRRMGRAVSLSPAIEQDLIRLVWGHTGLCLERPCKCGVDAALSRLRALLDTHAPLPEDLAGHFERVRITLENVTEYHGMEWDPKEAFTSLKAIERAVRKREALLGQADLDEMNNAIATARREVARKCAEIARKIAYRNDIRECHRIPYAICSRFGIDAEGR